MSQLLILGSEIENEGETWRIIRIVADDLSLFENAEGKYIAKESYAMVKSARGVVDFIMISSERLEYEGPTSTIKALENLPWRKS